MVEPVQEDLQDCPAIGANSFEAGISQKVMVKEMPSQDMSHLRKWSETTLGCVTAERAVADGPSSIDVPHRFRAGNARSEAGPARCLLEDLEPSPAWMSTMFKNRTVRTPGTFVLRAD